MIEKDYNRIDFVVPWVQGNDPEWLKEKEKYCEKYKISSGAIQAHYRDWDTFRYWFRAVEQNAPWVNKIHFITWGHLPSWLNIEHPKIHIVNHKDYIPVEYLPTYSSHVLEMFLHNIPSLSQQFVYFNDDVFLNKPIKENVFFQNGLPLDCAVMETLSPNVPEDPFVHYLANDISVINHNFNKKVVIQKNLYHFFTLKYGRFLLKNVINSLSGAFSGFHNFHMPQPFLKSMIEEVWEKEPSILNHTAEHRFRDRKDVNQYVFKYWQIASGNFVPCSPKEWQFYTVGERNEVLYDDIINAKHSLICINDSLEDLDFDKENADLVRCFEKRYPQKSSFEKD